MHAISHRRRPPVSVLRIDARSAEPTPELALEASGLPASRQWKRVSGTNRLIRGDDLAVGDLVEVVITDRDLDVDDSPNVFVVTVTSTTDPAGIAVTLTETGPQTGVFSAVIELAETSDESAGQLAAVDGDAISASYA